MKLGLPAPPSWGEPPSAHEPPDVAVRHLLHTTAAVRVDPAGGGSVTRLCGAMLL